MSRLYKLERWSSELERWSSELERWSSELERWSSELERWSSELERWSSELERCSSELERCSSELERCSSELERCSSELERCSSELERCSSELERCSSELERCSSELERLHRLLPAWGRSLLLCLLPVGCTLPHLAVAVKRLVTRRAPFFLWISGGGFWWGGGGFIDIRGFVAKISGDRAPTNNRQLGVSGGAGLFISGVLWQKTTGILYRVNPPAQHLIYRMKKQRNGSM
jgi:archaellum component FlaC